MKTKQERYNNLLKRFRNFEFTDSTIKNPHKLSSLFKSYNVINPWEIWHGDLSPETMIIGQDYNNQIEFTKTFGEELQWEWDTTEFRLRDLYSILNNQDIGLPTKSKKLPLFFTNAIWGMKNGKKSSSTKVKWYKETSSFMQELIEILEPCSIICMSKVSYNLLRYIYPQIKSFKYMYEAIDYNGKYDEILIGDKKSKVFIIAHCSKNGERNRISKQQEKDWEKLKKHLSKCRD